MEAWLGRVFILGSTIAGKNGQKIVLEMGDWDSPVVET